MGKHSVNLEKYSSGCLSQVPVFSPGVVNPGLITDVNTSDP